MFLHMATFVFLTSTKYCELIHLQYNYLILSALSALSGYWIFSYTQVFSMIAISGICFSWFNVLSVLILWFNDSYLSFWFTVLIYLPVNLLKLPNPKIKNVILEIQSAHLYVAYLMLLSIGSYLTYCKITSTVSLLLTTSVSLFQAYWQKVEIDSKKKTTLIDKYCLDEISKQNGFVTKD